MMFTTTAIRTGAPDPDERAALLAMTPAQRYADAIGHRHAARIAHTLNAERRHADLGDYLLGLQR